MLKSMMLCATLLSAAMLPTQSALAGPANAAGPIPQQQLLDYLAGKADFTLIDARSADEYAAGHIYNAVSVPVDADLDASAVLPKDMGKPLVVYCKSGKRALALQEKLQAKGYTNVRVLLPAQMLWADDLPVFNCGATVSSAPNSLKTVDQVALAGETP